MNRPSKLKRFVSLLQVCINHSYQINFSYVFQIIYDKSRVHYLVPIILLIAYSVLGGLIFWSIERPNEEIMLADKVHSCQCKLVDNQFQRNYIAALTDDLVEVLMQIHNRLIDFNRVYSNNTYLLMIHYRGYRKFALNQIHKVNWCNW